jgi:hypothetical protein
MSEIGWFDTAGLPSPLFPPLRRLFDREILAP